MTDHTTELEDWADILTRTDVDLWMGYDKDGPIIYYAVAGHPAVGWCMEPVR